METQAPSNEDHEPAVQTYQRVTPGVLRTVGDVRAEEHVCEHGWRGGVSGLARGLLGHHHEPGRCKHKAGRTNFFGNMPVDLEHKATELSVWSLSFPHMISFHCSWLGFFTTFVSTFAAAPMVPIIRNDIDMNAMDLGNSGVAAVTGTIFCRVIMGVFCDTYGPRLGYAVLLFGTAPAIFAMANVSTPLGFILCRFFIGFGLATFVACQFWSSIMFTPKIVGIANGTCGGWGNLGGGVTQFLIPAVYSTIVVTQEPFTAWRWAFYLPGLMHIVVGVMVLFLAQDLPDGQYAALKKTGQMQQPNSLVSLKQGLKNYRMWCLVVSYGMCFGVGLTMYNVLTGYLFDQFDISLSTAGLLGSLFGIVNVFARSIGGFTSDLAARKYGMRGRLWALWIIQTVEGALCVLMGFAKDSLMLTLVFMVTFSMSVHASEGATYGVVPFISKRSLGVVTGFVGAGGNAGGAIFQLLFFKTGTYETYVGIQLMGLMIMFFTVVVNFIYFPMWGGMWFPADGTTTEEDYYCNVYSDEEKEKGMADAAYKFSANARITERTPIKEVEADTDI